MRPQDVFAERSRSLRAVLPLRAVAAAFAIAAAGCSPAPQTAGAPAVGTEWRDFEGTWTAAGSRQSIALGADRKASVSTLRGSLLLSGAVATGGRLPRGGRRAQRQRDRHGGPRGVDR